MSTQSRLTVVRYQNTNTTHMNKQHTQIDETKWNMLIVFLFVYTSLRLTSLQINTSKWSYVKKAKREQSDDRKWKKKWRRRRNQRHQTEYICICSNSEQLGNCQRIFLFSIQVPNLLELNWIEFKKSRMGKTMSLIFAPNLLFFSVDFGQRTFNALAATITHTNTNSQMNEKKSLIRQIKC